MRDLNHKNSKIDIYERVRILGDETLCLAKISDQYLRRANQERISDQQAIWLIDFMRSFEFFNDLETYFFYHFDPDDQILWDEILDHVYRRSVTANYLMN